MGAWWKLLLGSIAVPGLIGLGCLMSDGACPCGSDIADPLAEHDASFSGFHVLEDACACRCGDGPLETWPLDGNATCEHADAECEDGSGQTAELSCDP